MELETNEMLTTTLTRLRTPCVQKVKIRIQCGRWPIVDVLDIIPKRLQMVRYQNNFMSQLFLNMLSILHYEINFWRFDASKMGRDFLDTL